MVIRTKRASHLAACIAFKAAVDEMSPRSGSGDKNSAALDSRSIANKFATRKTCTGLINVDGAPLLDYPSGARLIESLATSFKNAFFEFNIPRISQAN